jgi:GcrA cell cycle regulator
MESMNWPPAHSDALRKYFALGMSYAEIARAINAEFNTSYSRCAAIGRARRLGLGAAHPLGEATTPTPIPASMPRSRPQSLQKLAERYKAMAKWFVPFFEQVDAPKLRSVDADPLHLSLLALGAGDCRYPYGGDEEGEVITFCGRPKYASSSYCAAHFHLTRRLDAMPQSSVSAAALRVVEAA